MQTIGRNDPCPCGSGRKFKNCCEQAGRPEHGEPEKPWATELKLELQGRDFSSLEELNAVVKSIFESRNLRPRSDFHGLSPKQMHHVLDFPFDSPYIVEYAEKLPATPDTPIIRLFGHLVDAIGEKGLKPTAKGYLPRVVCREIALSYWDEETYRKRTEYGQINKELDFYDLHVTRIVAQLAGLVRKYRGRFILSRNCRTLLKSGSMEAIWRVLFKTFAVRFNWGYWDYYPEIHFLQRSFLFTLFLLSKYGQAWRPASFYEDQFVRAFPKVLDEVAERPYRTPEETVRSSYTVRALERFAGFLGLAEIRHTGDRLIDRETCIRRTSLLTEALTFHV